MLLSLFVQVWDEFTSHFYNDNRAINDLEVKNTLKTLKIKRFGQIDAKMANKR